MGQVIVNKDRANLHYKCYDFYLNPGESKSIDVSTTLGVPANTFSLSVYDSEMEIVYNDASNDTIPMPDFTEQDWSRLELAVDWFKVTNVGSTRGRFIAIATG